MTAVSHESQHETDLQCAHRLQKWMKDTSAQMKDAQVELDFCINRIKNSGVLSDGEYELINKPKYFWNIDVNVVKAQYPLIIPGIADKINADAANEIEKLNDRLPVGLVKDAMKFYGVVDKKGDGDLSGVGVQEPKDQWFVIPMSTKFSLRQLK